MGNIDYRRLYQDGGTASAPLPTDIFSARDKYYSDVVVNALSDARTCYVLLAGHEMSWPEKVVAQRNDRFTIHYIVSGSGYFNGNAIGAGSCFAVFPNQEYTLINDPSSPLEKYWISLRGPQTTDYITRANFDRMPTVSHLESMDHVVRIFNDMIYTPHPDADLELYLFGCFNMLLSYHKTINEREQLHSHSDSGHTYYKMAKEFILGRYNERVTVNDIAEHIHISSSYLRSLFLRFEGRPIGEVILDHKLETAKSLLSTSEYSVCQISGILGYADYSTFSKFFKKRTGLSPTEYRAGDYK